jgi:hypothetical protein
MSNATTYEQVDNDDSILFFAETNNCSIIKTLIEGIKEFSATMDIYLTDQSMHINVISKLDGSHIQCTLEADKFNHYKLNFDGMSSYGTLKNKDGTLFKKMKRLIVETSPLQRLFKNVKSQNKIRFLLVKGDEMRFKIDLINESLQNGVRFHIQLLKPEMTDPGFLSKTTFQHVISLTTANLKEKVGHIKSVVGATYVNITYNGKMLIFSSKGDMSEIQSIEQQIQSKNTNEQSLMSPCVKGINLGCLNGIVKFSNISTRVEMHMDDKQPMLFSFDMADFGRLIVVPAQMLER